MSDELGARQSGGEGPSEVDPNLKRLQDCLDAVNSLPSDQWGPPPVITEKDREIPNGPQYEVLRTRPEFTLTEGQRVGHLEPVGTAVVAPKNPSDQYRPGYPTIYSSFEPVDEGTAWHGEPYIQTALPEEVTVVHYVDNEGAPVYRVGGIPGTDETAIWVGKDGLSAVKTVGKMEPNMAYGIPLGVWSGPPSPGEQEYAISALERLAQQGLNIPEQISSQ